MNTYIKVAGILYPATINGVMNDYEWDNRESKKITLTMTYNEVLSLLSDDVSWSIVQQDNDSQTENEWDNSAYSLSGDITDHRNGTVTIKMGKPTDLENAYEILIGG